jgi:HEAT repeat protein
MSQLANTTKGMEQAAQAAQSAQSAQALAGEGEGDLSPRLMNWLADPDPRVRIQAIEEISGIREEWAITRMIDLTQHDPDLEVRCAALSSMGYYVYLGACSVYDEDPPELFQEIPQQDFERVCNFLLSVYRDPDRTLDEKRCAVEAQSYVMDDTAEDVIAELYARPEKEAKLSALRAMGRNGLARWQEILRREMYSTDLDVQIEAIEAAGEMSAEALGKDLLRLTYADDRDVLLSALWALGQTGWEGAFDRLDELTLDPDPEVREVADEALDEWLFFSGLNAETGEDEDDEFLDLD